jgi:hypothetical protein
MNRTIQKIKTTIVQVAIAGLIGAFFWVGFAVYQALTNVPTIVMEPGILDPFVPNLDEGYLEELLKRRQLYQELDGIVIAEPIVVSEGETTPESVVVSEEVVIEEEEDAVEEEVFEEEE